jgi:hypothetical protein
VRLIAPSVTPSHFSAISISGRLPFARSSYTSAPTKVLPPAWYVIRSTDTLLRTSRGYSGITSPIKPASKAVKKSRLVAFQMATASELTDCGNCPQRQPFRLRGELLDELSN